MPEELTILVIDDSEDDRFLYRRTLRSNDTATINIIEKDNGEDGFNCIESDKPDCILLDYSLPGRNGIEVLKRIRAKYPFVPVLMLTGQGNEAVAVNAMREGAQHYISKSSISPETLPRSIRVAIEHCTLQHHIHEQRTSLELFTRALAHDLKEPVRTIRSFVDLVTRKDLPPEKTEQYFTYIRNSAERMGELIDMVYFYMRLDSSAPGIEREACDSQQAWLDVQQNLAALIKERQATITSGNLPMVHANRIQLIQIMQNLLSNAIHHSADKPMITISAETDGDHWLFKIKDNGPGIAPEHIEKIFEPFKRVGSTYHEGLGLGLAICRKIIDSSGNKIWCEPTGSAGGACFCFTLQSAQPAATPKELPAAQEVTSSPTSEETEELASILVVEDNEADAELVRFALQDEKNMRCNLFISRNGQDALNQVARKSCTPQKIDLILLDINMPGIDGFEFLSRIRSQPAYAETPVFMCSTSTYDKDIKKSKLLGSNGYFVKPFDFSKMSTILDAVPRLQLRREGRGYALCKTNAARAQAQAQIGS